LLQRIGREERHGKEAMTTFKTEIKAVVKREVSLPGGVRRHLTYWLCRESLISGAGTYHITCHSLDRSRGKLVREKVSCSGDLGDDEAGAAFLFTVLTGVAIPIDPDLLHEVARDLLLRDWEAVRRPLTIQEFNQVARLAATSLLAKLQAQAM
jgi:hypothetical protein